MDNSKQTKEIKRDNDLLEIRWVKNTDNPKIRKATKTFIKNKSGKTIRVQSLELCLPIRDYKKVVNRALNKRVKDNTRLNEQDLRALIKFIDKVISIRDKRFGTRKHIRLGSTFNPWEYDELSDFLGKSYKKKDKENDGGYGGIKTVKSIRPVKHRTNRTQ